MAHKYECDKCKKLFDHEHMGMTGGRGLISIKKIKVPRNYEDPHLLDSVQHFENVEMLKMSWQTRENETGYYRVSDIDLCKECLLKIIRGTP